MMRYFILDDHGAPKAVPAFEFAGWRRRAGLLGRRVAQTRIPRAGVVSTVFLGFDRRSVADDGEGPPILWETKVIGGPLGGERARYTSAEQAKAGHAAMVARVKVVRRASERARAYERAPERRASGGRRAGGLS